MKKRRIFKGAVFLLLWLLLPGAGVFAEEENSLAGLKYTGSLALSYAEQFSVDYYDEDYALISIQDGSRFLVVPEGKEAPEGLDEDITVLRQPVENIYLVATSAMDLFRAIGGIENIRLSGTEADGWYIEEAREAMENGDILYAGKYSAPDYERIVAENCGLAVESTMILHNPEVKEMLENFGIPVMVERSSYELYAVILDKEAEADAIFKEQQEMVEEIGAEENTGKTVAFFYISSNGYVNVRKANDYVSKMIQLAGGEYVFSDLGDSENALSTMNMQMEDFYAGAKDADYIIYNSTIDGELETMEQLLEKSSLLGDFKAVQNGNAWCTGKNLFQETTGIGTMIADMHQMLTEDDPSLTELTYMHKLQ